jgi:hypothetical protein
MAIESAAEFEKKLDTFKPETWVEHNGLKVSKKFLEELIAYISFTTFPCICTSRKAL